MAWRPSARTSLLRFEGDVVLRSHLRMNGRWRRPAARRAAPARRALARPPRERVGGDAVERPGACARRPTRVRGLGPDLLAPETRPGRRSSSASGAPISRAGSERRSSTSASSPGSGTCGSPRCSGRRACRHGRDSRASRTNGSRPRSDWGRNGDGCSRWTGDGDRAAVYRRAGRGCRRCGDVIRSGGLGDANRTAYWCPSCQPDGDSAEREGFEPSTSGLPPVTP